MIRRLASRPQSGLLLGFGLLLLIGCRRDRDPPAPWTAVRTTVALGERGGLSDATASDTDGRYWAVLERDPVLLTLAADSGGLKVVGSLPIFGADPALDLEAVTRLAPGRIAIGTEKMAAPRLSEMILLATVTATAAVVTGRIQLSYSAWSMKGAGNQGIEGLCVAGSRLLAAVETTRHVGAKRTAPLGRYDLTRRRWTAFDVALTSETGKLSALSCRRVGDRIIAWAIERHYTVCRVIRFEVPLDGPGRLLVPTIVVDAGLLYRDIPNFETLLPIDGGFLLVADNQSATISGPTQVLALTRTTTTSTTTGDGETPAQRSR